MPNLRLNVLLDGDTRLDDRALAMLSRVEIREGERGPNMALLRFALAQEPSGEWYPVDHDVFTPARELVVELAPPGGLTTRMFVGHVSHVRPHFETVEANCYVEILALDRAALMDVQDRCVAWPDASESEVAEAIFATWGLDAELVELPTVHPEQGLLMVQRESDWSFLQRLARRSGQRCWLEIDGDSGSLRGYFGPLPFDRDAQADLTMLPGESNLLWLDMQLLTLAPTRRVGAAIDPLEKRVIRSESEPSRPVLGDDGLIEAITAGLREHGVGDPVRLLRDPWPRADLLDARASAESDDLRMLVEARGELDPSLYRGLLRAHRPVLVKGVGRRFAGTWWVEAVRTVLDEGVLRQTFVLRRNDLGVSGAEDFGRSAEEVDPR